MRRERPSMILSATRAPNKIILTKRNVTAEPVTFLEGRGDYSMGRTNIQWEGKKYSAE